MMSFCRVFMPVVLVLIVSGAAHAVTTLATPLTPCSFYGGGLFGYVAVCEITNIDTKPAAVAATLLDVDGNVVTAGSSGCPTPTLLSPGHSCAVHGPASTLGSIPGGTYCKFTSTSSKVRAVSIIEQEDVGEIKYITPATSK